MTPHRLSLYTLAENLNRMVYELEEMPSSEYMGWLEYYKERSRQQEADNGNLMAMSNEDLIKGLTGG